MDYKGAIDAFEKALEVNPHSASAHFELGWLLEEKGADPAAAIYHYQQYLRLSPNAENAANVNQHIQVLKQDLAKNVLPPSFTPEMQREFDQLAEDKRRLSEEVMQLRQEVQRWRDYYATHEGDTAPQPSPVVGVNMGRRNLSGTQAVTPPDSTAAVRTHKVEQGENPSSIARKYGIKVERLIAANPGLKPTQMQIGQAINIPVQ